MSTTHAEAETLHTYGHAAASLGADSVEARVTDVVNEDAAQRTPPVAPERARREGLTLTVPGTHLN
jgi:hypothetical protein